MVVEELKIRHVQRRHYETVLVMQGGGSLGAYECGVYKKLAKHGIRFDIVAGTSIGAVNAGIIAGSRSDHPEKDLEDFWLDVAETSTPTIMPDDLRAIASSTFGALYGNPKVFAPVWFTAQGMNYGNYFLDRVPYLYDLKALKNTLEKYVDFERINRKNSPRLVVTCTDIKKGESLVFDSMTTNFRSDHLVACASFPFYGIGWTEIDGKALWDGALLSNTPLREVIDSSPKHDKKVYLVNLFPRVQEDLPKNLMEVWHRARDVMHAEKTDQNVKMSKVISKYLLLLRDARHNKQCQT